MNRFFKLIVSVAIPLLVGWGGSYFTASSVKTWFITLKKPFFNPPSWVFAPVWTVLYIVMGIAFYLTWINKGADKGLKKKSMAIYFFQLLLNFLWSVIFFYLMQPGWAFAEILILLAVIVATAYYFYRISATAGWLMVPYILWVCFATALNYAIWQLNH